MQLKFSDIYSTEALYESAFVLYNKAMFFPKKAKVRSYDNKSLYDFGISFQTTIRKIQKQLEKQSFLFGPLLEKTIILGDKSRQLYLSPWEEKLVETMLYRLLDRKLNSILYSKSFAFRQQGSKGVQKCIQFVDKMLKEQSAPLYVIRRDVSNFFPSIDREILRGFLAKHIDKEDYLFRLLESRVDFIKFGSEEVEKEKGVSFGTPLACLFGNLYLTELDRKLYEITPNVIRYADDYLIATPDLTIARRVIEAFKSEFVNLKVTSKPSHEQNLVWKGASIEEFTSTKEVQYLGLRFNETIRLDKGKLNKIKRIFTSCIDKVLKGKSKRASIFERSLKAAKACDQIWTSRYNLKSRLLLRYSLVLITDEQQLRDLDRWLLEYLMQAACGYDGFRKKNFRYLDTEKLREAGLHSFLHESRLMKHGHMKESLWTLLTKER